MPLWLGWTIFTGVAGWAVNQFGDASKDITTGLVIATTAAVAAPFVIKALRGK